MGKKFKKFWKILGGGFITGASDDDPSGVTIYSIAGARGGFSMLWTLLYSLPLMIAIEHMSAKIGALSGCGLAGNIKKHYPKWILAVAASSLIFANILNIGADISGMASALNLLFPFPVKFLALIISALVLILTIKLSYKRIVGVFKWFAISLLSYILAFFLVKADWVVLLKNTLIPSFPTSRESLMVLFALLGTTISPYVYFWGASEEAEETQMEDGGQKICKFREVRRGRLHRIELDTKLGMIFSNLVAFFIIALTASTLYNAGAHNIETLRQAAEALRPLAGNYAYIIFTAGLLGSGLLSIPVLAGGAAYVLAEIFGWRGGLDSKFQKAKQFYIVIISAVLLGLVMTFMDLSPVKTLFYAGIINAMVCPLIILLVIHMANNSKIVGPYRMKPVANYVGYLTFLIMSAGTLFVFLG